MWFTFLPAHLPRNHRFELDISLDFVLLLVLDSDGRELGEDKASKDFREARANGRVLSSQVVKEFK